MENLSMCRICLSTKNDLGMKELLDNSLQEMYHELTYMQFVTKDGRPTLVCYVCLARLRNFHKLRVQCVRSEQFFTQVLNGDSSPNKVDVFSTNSFKTKPVFLLTVGGQTEMSLECEVKSEPAIIDLVENDSEECYLFENDYACPPQGEFYVELDVTKVDPDENTDIDLEDIIQVPKRENIEDATSEVESTDRNPKKSNWITQKLIFVDNESDGEEKNNYAPVKTGTIDKEFDYQRIFVDNELKIEPISEEIDNMKLLVAIENDCDVKNDHALHKNLSRNSENLGNTSVSHSYEEGEKVLNNCEQCSKIFSTPSNLQRHILRMHSEKKYKCGVCDKCYSIKSDFDRHIAAGHNNMPKKDVLSKHHLDINNHHKNIIKTYQCGICIRTFSSKGGMLRHASSMHSGHTIPKGTLSDKDYVCDICRKNFNTKAKLIGHIWAHIGYKPFKCNVCKNRFSDKSTLQRHMLVHSNEKPFTCDFCGNRFRRKHHLEQHYRWHTGEKVYQCDVCKRSFKQKAHLSVHTRIHTGEKEIHTCNVCGRSFTFRCSLKRHIIRAHQNAQ